MVSTSTTPRLPLHRLPNGLNRNKKWSIEGKGERQKQPLKFHGVNRVWRGFFAMHRLRSTNSSTKNLPVLVRVLEEKAESLDLGEKNRLLRVQLVVVLDTGDEIMCGDISSRLSILDSSCCLVRHETLYGCAHSSHYSHELLGTSWENRVDLEEDTGRSIDHFSWNLEVCSNAGASRKSWKRVRVCMSVGGWMSTYGLCI